MPDAWQVCQATMSLVGGAVRAPGAGPAHAALRRIGPSGPDSLLYRKHLTDPDLTPASIASGCQINVRYMHRLQALWRNETLARATSCGAAWRSARGR